MTREELMELASTVWGEDPGKPWSDSAVHHLEKFAGLVAAKEREACAKLCEDLHDCEPEHSPDDCAAAIRSQGDK
jgi:hypothetical protein